MKKILTLILGLMLTGVTLAEDRVIRINNFTKYSIVAMYGSYIGTDNWEENILRGKIVLPYHTHWVDMFDESSHCLFDLKAEYSTGEIIVRRKVDVCTVSYWNIYE